MKALIFNSGLGSRMGVHCESCPKGLLPLYNGETILERQIRILSTSGIREFVITTGPFPEKIKEVEERFPGLIFTFVENKEYRETNYIVSLYLAAEYLTEDVLILHGDLVFNRGIVNKLLKDTRTSLCLFHETKPLPEKDFKGRFADGKLKEVSVSIFSGDCYAFQPFYKLDKNVLTVWMEKVKEFVESGNRKVYAENALNEITGKITIEGLSWQGEYIEEIDNEEDYRKVSDEIRFYDYREQRIEVTDSYIESLKRLLKEYGDEKKVFVVCSRRYEKMLSGLWKNIVFFHGYTPNPQYSEIREGARIFQKNHCDLLIAVGGGSAMDTAKCIKMLSGLENPEELLLEKYEYSPIPLIAIPTTAGTGSESTQIAVFYHEGKKYSLQHGSLVPTAAFLDASLLHTLPDLQKKVTLLDALCQGIESFWAVGATEESRKYAKTCIRLIMDNYESYLEKGEKTEEIMLAANYSGRAINISRTTAAHAMSYQLTSRYGIPHGQAVGLCIVPIWRLMKQKARTEHRLENCLRELAGIMGEDTIEGSIVKIENLIAVCHLPVYHIPREDIRKLAESVDSGRMGNHPVVFTDREIEILYEEVVALTGSI